MVAKGYAAELEALRALVLDSRKQGEAHGYRRGYEEGRAAEADLLSALKYLVHHASLAGVLIGPIESARKAIAAAEGAVYKPLNEIE